MNYTINQYLIYQVSDSNAVLQTEKSISIIKNSNMIKFLEEKQNKEHLATEEIAVFFGNRTKQATEYLFLQGVIKKRKELNFDVENIYLVYNGEFSDSLIPKKLEGINLHIYDLETFHSKEIMSHSLVILILNKYHPDYVEKIKNKIDVESNTYLLTTFSYNFKYYMDNIYSKTWEVPNHDDHIGIIQTEILDTESSISYVQILNAIFKESPLFEIERPLEDTEALFLLNCIFKQVYKVFGMSKIDYLRDYVLLETKEIDILNRVENTDYAVFWEFTR